MAKNAERSTTHTVGLLIVLTVVWLLWSGHYTVFVLSLGALSVGLVVFLSDRMGIVDDEGQPLSWGPVRPIIYLPWLVVEVIKANLDVARRVLSPSMPISPTVTRIPAPQRTALGRVIYANSITLTPGTVSIELDDNSILVHALSADGVADLRSGVMAAKVCALEGDG
ncbi:MAG: Na+/H+ antiporter subunit E [Myxococcota bacterium]